MCGVILPLWNPMQKSKSGRALSVRRSLVDGKPIIGVYMQKKDIELLKKDVRC